MSLLKREKERQEQSKKYYAEHYTVIYINEERQLNTTGDGKPVNLVNIRENGEFIIPRTMQHTSGIIHYKMNYPDFDFHSLRHTHATLLAESDVPPKYLQKRMGHSNLEVTMKFYLHLTDKMQEKGSDILKNVFQTKEETKD